MVIAAYEPATQTTGTSDEVSFGNTIVGQANYNSADIRSQLPRNALIDPANTITIVSIFVNGVRQNNSDFSATIDSTTGIIRLTFNTAPTTADQAIVGYFNILFDFDEDFERIYPADRCTWIQGYETATSQYVIDSARFFDGSNPTGTILHRARLGYIGKSGRFVEIAR